LQAQRQGRIPTWRWFSRNRDVRLGEGWVGDLSNGQCAHAQKKKYYSPTRSETDARLADHPHSGAAGPT